MKIFLLKRSHQQYVANIYFNDQINSLEITSTIQRNVYQEKCTLQRNQLSLLSES